jgi:acyl-CoA thioester hydrolase
MPKVKLHRYPEYPFETRLRVRVGDLNYGAHLGYDRLLGLVHQARLELFSTWNITETDLGDGATGLVVGDLVVNYLGEGFLHDDLRIQMTALEIGTIAFRLAHRITRGDQDVALVETGFVGFDYNRRMPARLPDPFVQRLRQIVVDTER